MLPLEKKKTHLLAREYKSDADNNICQKKINFDQLTRFHLFQLEKKRNDLTSNMALNSAVSGSGN